MKISLKRPSNCHKGSFGHLLVIAGSRGMAGAAQLTVMAALRSGAGKTTIATTQEIYRIIGKAIPEAMSLTFGGDQNGRLDQRDVSKILSYSRKVTAIAIGPGIGRSAGTQKLLCKILAEAHLPMILDADALWALEGDPCLLKKAKVCAVITPHDGEFRRLFKNTTAILTGSRRSVAKRIANQYHCVLVRKGPRSLVASPCGKIFLNSSGNPGLAKGGSGDVLTGVIGALLAQGLEPWLAASLGVYAHGRSADIAARASSQTSLTASDVIGSLAVAWSELEKKRDLAGFLGLGK